jgi:hypothetical protein
MFWLRLSRVVEYANAKGPRDERSPWRENSRTQPLA